MPSLSSPVRAALLCAALLGACSRPAEAPAGSGGGPTRVDVAVAESSIALRDAVEPPGPREEVEHEVRHNPRARELPFRPDTALQTLQPIASLPVAIQNFLGQGHATSSATVTGTPPDTVGAVGPNHYVQLVNGGIAVWNKSGALVAASKLLNALWAGYTGTNPGNHCASNNDGDPIVVYDQLADRWVISQFAVPSNNGPDYECVAVSQTGDPTGAYWLYDFRYSGFNDYPKMAVWPDAYYYTCNMFGAGSNGDSDFCAMDRVKMLAGQPATQVCFQQGGSVFGALPTSLDGPIPPPAGTPGFFMQLGGANASLDLWTFHVDWSTPANTRLNGPTSLAVAAFNPACGASGTCVPQGGGTKLDALSDRLMFRSTYRNFGTHASLLANHSVTAGSTAGIRWYEIRDPAGTPAVFQQGTYAPADSNWRWMGSIAQDQAQDLLVGFSISSSTSSPSIGWTGRLSTDAAGTMGQGETVFANGTGRSSANRWGDYSALTVDPADDCTFWYTTELYNTTGTSTWDTRIASLKFPGCGANDFSVGVTPASGTIGQGGQTAFTVTTASTKGTPETVVLNVQDLPAGVSGAFSPASVTAGGSATLTLTATAGAPATGTPAPAFTVIGTAPSAVHAATAQVAVLPCTPLSACPAPDDCGTIPDGCGGIVACGPGCTTPNTCGGGGTQNVCGCKPLAACPAPDDCGTIPDGCGGTVTCAPGCTAPNTCGGGGTPNVCGCKPLSACPAPDECGTLADGCGGTLTCGPGCTAPNTCGGGGTANRCGCQPRVCAASECGTPSDGCGGTLTCTCATGSSCQGSTCVPLGPDGGSAADGGTAADGGSAADGGPKPDGGAKPDGGGAKPDGGGATADAGGGGAGAGGCHCGSFGLGESALLGAALGALRRRRHFVAPSRAASRRSSARSATAA